MAERIAVVLFNLGGPDSLEAVAPYLRNLFSDPAIIRLPSPLRGLLANFIANRRAPYAREEIFAKIGGASPILPQTRAQADALQHVLFDAGIDARIFIAMRYWHPRASEAAKEIAAYKPDRTVLLPLYPQYSTTTSASSIAEFEMALDACGHTGRTERICCYPAAPGFIAGLAERITPLLSEARRLGTPRILFSAHGLPESVVRAGDPYVWQVEQTVHACVDALGKPGLDWSICYQSRVGPLKWTGPSIDEEIARAIADKRVIVIVPVAFVCEHSETLVELDIKYREIAETGGAAGYFRVPTVGIENNFIEALAELVRAAANPATSKRYCNARICPREYRACPNSENLRS